MHPSISLQVPPLSGVGSSPAEGAGPGAVTEAGAGAEAAAPSTGPDAEASAPSTGPDAEASAPSTGPDASAGPDAEAGAEAGADAGAAASPPGLQYTLQRELPFTSVSEPSPLVIPQSLPNTLQSLQETVGLSPVLMQPPCSATEANRSASSELGGLRAP